MTSDAKRLLLDRGMGIGADGRSHEPLLTDDQFVRDNVRVVAEALQLGLVKLVPCRDGTGHVVVATSAGRAVRSGAYEDAARHLGSGSTPMRIEGDPPRGPIGRALAPGAAPLSLDAGYARAYAPELLRGVATGHVRVEGGHASAAPPRRHPTEPANDRPRPRFVPPPPPRHEIGRSGLADRNLSSRGRR